MEAYATITITEGVGYIEFYHPNKNAMPSALLLSLEQLIIKAGKNEAIKVIVLRSGGDRTFCAGANFNELITIENENTGKNFFLGFAKVINAMRECPKLIIGRVQGKAVGGGLGLIAATDYCLATKHAAIKLSELSIGIGPFVIEPAVTRKIGIAAMSQMTINAESFFSADFAKEKGLYAEVFETLDHLDEGVNGLVNKLVGYNPEAVKEMKRVFWEGTDNWDLLLEARAEKSGKLVLSSFTKEVLKRFM